ncbi:hypothetical protein P7K49_013306, partial [Saguinus oedipus]
QTIAACLATHFTTQSKAGPVQESRPSALARNWHVSKGGIPTLPKGHCGDKTELKNAKTTMQHRTAGHP